MGAFSIPRYVILNARSKKGSKQQEPAQQITISLEENELASLSRYIQDKTQQKQESLKGLEKAILESCFMPSLRAMLLFRDIAYALTFVIPASYLYHLPYSGVGLWILVRECGHDAFFSPRKVNNLVVQALHSVLHFPYFSWKINHACHHRSTGHMEKHTVFVPSTKEEYSLKTPKAEGVHELREDAHLMTALRLSGHQLLGFLMYLLINISAGSGSIPPTKAGLGSFASHLYPLGNLFISSQKVKVVVSGLSIATMVHPLALVGQRIGWGNVLLFYFLPYVWVNHWIGKTSR
ncbi:hypothetical protein PENANT_c005G02314 [Penicillium antarcticum]|uniref:Fatty acid desaturase domain-containing protein n=1 Tax=Penicillium antarcticum TaxID=416450 RepID=A0A1V6QES9_9EURO|nr:hypothetical protein PENANT_c005G02314 [Penicillium antarcticum]